MRDDVAVFFHADAAAYTQHTSIICRCMLSPDIQAASTLFHTFIVKLMPKGVTRVLHFFSTRFS